MAKYWALCYRVCFFGFLGYNVQRTMGNSGPLSGLCLQEESTFSTVDYNKLIRFSALLLWTNFHFCPSILLTMNVSLDGMSGVMKLLFLVLPFFWLWMFHWMEWVELWNCSFLSFHSSDYECFTGWNEWSYETAHMLIFRGWNIIPSIDNAGSGMDRIALWKLKGTSRMLKGRWYHFFKTHISVHNSFMLTPIDLVMVLKESSFKELSNDILFVQVLHSSWVRSGESIYHWRC